MVGREPTVRIDSVTPSFDKVVTSVVSVSVDTANCRPFEIRDSVKYVTIGCRSSWRFGSVQLLHVKSINRLIETIAAFPNGQPAC